MKTKFSLHSLAALGIILIGTSLAQTSHASNGGSNTGGSDRASSLQAWCRNADGILDDAYFSAKLAAVNGNYSDAKIALMRGLKDALAATANQTNSIDRNQSLTYRLLSRGLEISSAMDEVIGTTADPVQLARAVEVLISYYDFIHKTSYELDLNHYIAAQVAMHDHKHLNAIEQTAFEHRFEQFAKDQIQWLLTSFVKKCTSDLIGESKLCIKGSDQVFFKLAELVTSYAVSDLNDSLFDLRYACVSDKLARVQGRLGLYNAGDVSAIGGARLGLNTYVYPRLNEYSNQIEIGCGR